MKKIEMTLIANAGILVEYDQKKLLIDGIYHTKMEGFSNIPDRILSEIRSGYGKMSDVDCLLFTHAHEDHFSADLLLELLNNGFQKERYVLLPSGMVLKDTGKMKGFSEKSEKCKIEFHVEERIPLRLMNEIELEVLPVKHMGEAYQDVQNNCLLVTLGTNRILFTGDAEPNVELFRSLIGNRKILGVFVNPLFYHQKEGTRIIEEILKPEFVVVYHVPFPEDDKFYLGKMAGKDMASRKTDQYATWILNQEDQKIMWDFALV